MDEYSVINDVSELQKMLTDERARSEQHRQNYQALKSDHTKLQEENVELQNELRSTIEEGKLLQEKYKHMYDQIRKDLSTKQAECNDLRAHMLSPNKIDLIRTQIRDEVEGPLREHLRGIQDEMDQYRSEYKKLQYDHAFLTSECQRLKDDHSAIVEELKTMHETELKDLRKERETLAERLKRDGQYDSQRLRAVQRENAQLQLKLKATVKELEESQAQREHLVVQSESNSRQATKLSAEQAANIKSLETERQSLKQQAETLQKEVLAQSEEHTSLLAKVHQLEKENLTLKGQADELQHSSKLELTELKMGMLKDRGDMERERDQLTNQIEDLKAQIEVLKLGQTKHENRIAEKEREIQRRVQSAREEEWRKINSLENEKMELETKVQELERRRNEEQEKVQADREKMEERLQQARESKEAAEKDALVLRTKVSHQDTMSHTTQRLELENSELRNRLSRIEAMYSSYIGCEQELVESNERLQKEAESARAKLQELQQETDKAQLQTRSAWQEEKGNLHRRVEELEEQTVGARRELDSVIELEKKRKKKISQIVSKLKAKVKYQAAKIDELKLERDTYKRFISPEKHVEVKKKLNDLIRRHQEFRNILMSDPSVSAEAKQAGDNKPRASHTDGFVGFDLSRFPDSACCSSYVPITPGPLSPAFSPGPISEVAIEGKKFARAEVESMNFLDLASQHQRDLVELKQRMDELDTAQRHQMAQLVDVPAGYTRHQSKSAPPGGGGLSIQSDKLSDLENLDDLEVDLDILKQDLEGSGLELEEGTDV